MTGPRGFVIKWYMNERQNWLSDCSVILRNINAMGNSCTKPEVGILLVTWIGSHRVAWRGIWRLILGPHMKIAARLRFPEGHWLVFMLDIAFDYQYPYECCQTTHFWLNRQLSRTDLHNISYTLILSLLQIKVKW